MMQWINDFETENVNEDQDDEHQINDFISE